MAYCSWDQGDVHESIFLADTGGRRFYFDDRHLPPVTEAARRTAARDLMSNMVRYAFEGYGVTGLPAGNLLDVVPDVTTGWRSV